MQSLLILKPFNLAFFVLMVLGVFLIWLITKILKNANDTPKKATYVAICIVTIVCYFLYKYALSLDADFNIINAAYGGFNWWKELPLHLCNIHLLLMPVAVLTNKRPLLSFCFFVAPLGALMALLMPGLGFSGYSILLPRMLGYHLTHLMVIVEAILIYTLDFYKPKYRDIPGSVLMLLAVSLVVFGINLLLRFTGLCASSNYFFLMDTEGNPVLEILYGLIPYPFLYALPCALVVIVYALILTAILQKTSSRKN